MIDIWICTTDMLKSISDKVMVETADYLHFTVYATDEEHTEIGTVHKTYKTKGPHIKCVTVELRRDSFYMQICANEDEQKILNKLSSISERILSDNMIIQIESM